MRQPRLSPHSAVGSIAVSLYQVQKFLFQLNRDKEVQADFRTEPERVLVRYTLTPEERQAIVDGDVGLLYVLGANGQLLMHFAAHLGMPWAQYIQAMREGVNKHGPVRAGIYAMTTRLDERVADV
jgi:hypothetical protein